MVGGREGSQKLWAGWGIFVCRIVGIFGVEGKVEFDLEMREHSAAECTFDFVECGGTYAVAIHVQGFKKVERGFGVLGDGKIL